MVTELIHDVKMLLEMRKCRDLAIESTKYHFNLKKERGIYTVYEMVRIRLEKEACILREEQHYADYKARLVRKWKGKLSKKQ